VHTAKSHIEIVLATTTQNVVAAHAFDRRYSKRHARRCSYAATATYADGQTRTVTRTLTFDAPPVVTFTSPNDFQTFGAINPTSPRDLTGNVERPVTLTGTVSKPFAQITRVMINQQSAMLTAAANGTQTTFTFPNFFLREGTNLVTATATDAGGQVGTASLTLYVDQTAPILTLEAPVNTGLAGLAMPFGVSSGKSNNSPTAAVPSALTSNARVDVRGIVNDAVEGGLKVPYPTVTVNNVTTGLTTPGKVSDRFFIVEDVPLDVGQNELTVTATDWVGNARSQKLTVSRVNVGSNRITLAGGNRQRGALNTELAKPLIVTAIDRAGLPLANIPLTFEVLRGTGSINPAATSSTTTTTGSGSNTVTTTIPNALTGNNQPKTKPNGVNPARRLLITTDANGRAAVWFTLGKQSGEAGNMVQVSASDANSANATIGANSSGASTSSARTGNELDAISESVVFTATGDRGVPAKILAEGGGAQYAETGGQPLDALTAVTYDGEVNPVPGAIIAYVIEQDGGVDVDDGAKFTTSSASNAVAISANRKVLITTADNNGRSAARPTMGTATGTVRISTYAMPPLAPNATVRPELVEGLANTGNGTNNALTTTPGLVGLATFQIAVLQQSDGPTQFTGKILDHTGKPLQGVRVTISRTPLSVTTDAAGNFTFLQDVPQGKLDLFVDGRAVTGTTPLPGGQTTPTQYPSLHFEVLAIRGQKNLLPHPIYLPPLLMSQAKIVGGNEDVSLTIPGRDGFEMIVKANSVTFPDGTRIGPLVVSPVADDRLPMSPPGGGSSFMPGAAATIQPSGTRFDPPIEVRLPNTSGYAPGERVVIYHWDHDIGQYVAMGQATVTDDGAQLITDPGSGITKAGWHGPPTPPNPPNCAQNPPPSCGACQKLQDASVLCLARKCEFFKDPGYSKERSVELAQNMTGSVDRIKAFMKRLGVSELSGGLTFKVTGAEKDICCKETQPTAKKFEGSVTFEGFLESEFGVPGYSVVIPTNVAAVIPQIFPTPSLGPGGDIVAGVFIKARGSLGGVGSGSFDRCAEQGSGDAKANLEFALEGTVKLAYQANNGNPIASANLITLGGYAGAEAVTERLFYPSGCNSYVKLKYGYYAKIEFTLFNYNSTFNLLKVENAEQFLDSDICNKLGAAIWSR
jgi:large repetitive protein